MAFSRFPRFAPITAREPTRSYLFSRADIEVVFPSNLERHVLDRRKFQFSTWRGIPESLVLGVRLVAVDGRQHDRMQYAPLVLPMKPLRTIIGNADASARIMLLRLVTAKFAAHHGHHLPSTEIRFRAKAFAGGRRSRPPCA